MNKEKNVLIVIGPECEVEAIALRSSLEFFGFSITVKPLIRPQQFIELFTTDKSMDNAGIIVFCFHGNKGKFRFQKLAKHRYEKGEWQSNIGITQLKKFLHFNGQAVICTGCDLGDKRIADAFLQAKASCYIGSKAGIDEDSALMFTIRLFYHLGRDIRLKSAFLKAKKMDRNISSFNLFS